VNNEETIDAMSLEESNEETVDVMSLEESSVSTEDDDAEIPVTVKVL
jgi:hypothetical protein